MKLNGINDGKTQSTKFDFRGRTYGIEVYPAHDGELIWCAYREGFMPGFWNKIPCFTRLEEQRFPKTVAKKAIEFFEKCQQRRSL